VKDPNAGRYSKIYGEEFRLAADVLKDEGGELAWSEHDWQAFTYKADDVCLIFYPHKTSAGNYHLRIRDQHSKNRERAMALINKLETAAGNNCTFQAKHHIAKVGQLRHQHGRGEYPRVRRNVLERFRGGRRRRGRKTCSRCGERTERWIRIEFGWSRGDDKRLKVCGPCQDELDDPELLALYEEDRERIREEQVR